VTKHYTFEIEFVTSDEIDENRAEKAVERFLDRLAGTKPFHSTKLTRADTAVQSGLPENEKARLIHTIDNVSDTECAVAISIAKRLSKTNE